MNDIHRFLAHAIRLEAEAARRFDELADHMATHGNTETEALFRQFSDWSSMHLHEVLEKAGFRMVSELPNVEYDWPNGASPESAPWWGVDALLTPKSAMELALVSEKLGMEFYQTIAQNSTNPKVVALAAEFAEEEQGHVAHLEKMLAKTPD